MKFAVPKMAAAAAAILSANLTWAAPVTISKPQLLGHNYIAFDFSSVVVAALNASGTTVTALHPSVVNSTHRSNGKYRTLSVGGMDLQAISFDDATRAILSVQYGGGFQLFAEPDGFPLPESSFSISNLRLDLVEKRIYASVHGANGVGSVDNIALWTAGTISGTTVLPVNALLPLLDGSGRVSLGYPPFDTRLSNLQLTNQGLDLWSQGLGYDVGGRDHLDAARTYFGAITTSAVPEPGTSALLLAGMAITGLATRRQRKIICTPLHTEA